MMRAAASALGLLVLGAAIVVGAFAAFGAFGPKAPQSPQTSSEGTTTEQARKAKQEAVSLGQTVTTGDLSWTISEAHPTTVIDKVIPPPRPRYGNFVVVTFTVKNVSDEPVTLVPGDMAIIDNDGEDFSSEAALNSGYVEFDRSPLFNELSLLEPGASREGEVNFELPVGAKGAVVRLGDGDPVANDEKYVDLEL